MRNRSLDKEEKPKEQRKTHVVGGRVGKETHGKCRCETSNIGDKEGKGGQAAIYSRNPRNCGTAVSGDYHDSDSHNVLQELMR